MPGPFTIESGVRSNVTLKALLMIKVIVGRHGPRFDEADLEATRSCILRANARAFETPGTKLGLLADMSRYGFPGDYIRRREEIVREMTVERIRGLAAEHLDVDGMVRLVLGDARTQLDRFCGLGLGEPVVVDRKSRSVSDAGA